MLIRLNDNTILNIKKVKTLLIRHEKKDAVIKKRFLFENEIVSPETTTYIVTLNYIDDSNRGMIYTSHYETSKEASNNAKYIADQIMSLDSDFVNRAFEDEVLK